MRSHEVFPGSTLTRRFRRRQLLRPRRPAWLNATAAVSILALLGIALAGTLLSRAGGGGDAAALAGYAQRTALPPAQLIVAGARTKPPSSLPLTISTA